MDKLSHGLLRQGMDLVSMPWLSCLRVLACAHGSSTFGQSVCLLASLSVYLPVLCMADIFLPGLHALLYTQARATESEEVPASCHGTVSPRQVLAGDQLWLLAQRVTGIAAIQGDLQARHSTVPAQVSIMQANITGLMVHGQCTLAEGEACVFFIRRARITPHTGYALVQRLHEVLPIYPQCANDCDPLHPLYLS